MVLLALALLAQSPDVKFNFSSYRGLSAEVGGVPLIQGSSFQYVEDGVKGGGFNSIWRPMKIEKLANGAIRARFVGTDGKALGNQLFEYTPRGFRAKYEFWWRGKKPVKFENCAALLWASALRDGAVRVDGDTPILLKQNARPSWDISARKFGAPSTLFEFDSPMTQIRVKATPGKATLYDARNMGREWSDGRDLLWFGFREQILQPDELYTYTVEWEFYKKTDVAAVVNRKEMPVNVQTAVQAATRDTEGLPLLPKPKSHQIRPGTPLIIGESFDIKVEPKYKRFAERFEQLLRRIWLMEPGSVAPGATKIEALIEDLKMPKEGYRITIDGEKVLLVGQDEAGLKHGFLTLAMLARPVAGQLVFDRLELKDWPTIGWRGLHLFVGPEALGFQTQLMDRVLEPLKLNKVVLQCDRTNWKAAGNIATEMTTSREDLAKLFANYRKVGIEPIPLIQSFGHMEWLFMNGENSEAALNKYDKYSIDPRKDVARKLIESIWTEAIQLLKPTSIHFGLDEVDKRGMPPDPYYTTRLWQKQVPFLLAIAAKHDITPMLWGDMMLAPGDAHDATHAPSQFHAKLRRSALTKGVTVCDWHYAEKTDSGAYPSLALWLRNGVRPVASYWFRPRNIRGASVAAAQNGAGTLLTTWAGYESSEDNMLKEFKQFTAIVLAADYAWSGRTELPSKLPYDDADVFRRLYSDEPSPVGSAPGVHLLTGPTTRRVQIGPVAFWLCEPVTLYCPLGRDTQASPSEVTIPVDFKAREVAFAVDCRAWVDDAEKVAEIEVELASGKKLTRALSYGAHIRADSDDRPTVLVARVGTLSAVRVDLGDKAERVVRLTVRDIGQPVGVRIHGITAF